MVTIKNKISNRLFIIFLLGISLIVLDLFVCWIIGPKTSHPKDASIVLDIAQMKMAMLNIYEKDGNYDNFTCKHKEIKAFCRDIDKNYGENPIIVHGSTHNSQTACVYSPLIYAKNYWYCADSSNKINIDMGGYTEINPNSPGYCLEGKNAVCPSFLKYSP